MINTLLDEHIDLMHRLKPLLPTIEMASEKIVKIIQAGGKVYWMGNGGSAADCQHLAAELIGRFQIERPPIASIALTTDTSVLTSVGNDYDFSSIFSRQIEGLCRANDMVIGLSTSGNSKNILKGIQSAKKLGTFTLGLTGQTPNLLTELADLTISIPSQNTARIQEAHIFIGHVMCEWVEKKLDLNGSPLSRG